jgi:hypothetical protein
VAIDHSCDNETSMTKPGFLAAMVCYALLALLAAFTLDHLPRAVVWLVLGALAAKTWIASTGKL